MQNGINGNSTGLLPRIVKIIKFAINIQNHICIIGLNVEAFT